MPTGIPVITAVLIGLAVILTWMGLWLLMQPRDVIGERLESYGLKSEQREQRPVDDTRNRYGTSRLAKILAGFGLGPRLALALTRADLRLTAAEFLLIVMAFAAFGFVIGILRVGVWFGLVLAVILGVLPFLYLGARRRRRLRDFTSQLPDLLTLLVGALRAGYGLGQAIEVVVERLPPPMSTEMEKVTRAVNLGLPLQQALEDAVERIGSEDFSMVVVAINVHYETGGNLAETLEIISDTVRDRLRMLAEIRVLTAQQRFTGYVLAALPLFTALAVFLINPGYIMDLFQPGWIRLLPAGAVFLQVLGFFVIRRIVDIEV